LLPIINGLQKFRPGTTVTPNIQAMASDDVLKQIKALQAQTNSSVVPTDPTAPTDQELSKNAQGE